ncbi:MAG: hypothetical protein Kow0068_12120 [Marinilabiliales bacterium]
MNFNEIIILMDYKNVFGSKHFAKPYRSGFDKNKIKDYLEKEGFKATFVRFNDIELSHELKNKIVIYTSSEDIGYYYKSFIEDIVLGLENVGAVTIPNFKFLRANNNKVFMEILRQQSSLESIKNIKSRFYGVLEEVLNDKDLKSGEYPKVLKLAEGATGKNVVLAYNYNDLIKKVKKLCRTRNIYFDLWDFGRSLKHKGYIRESLYRKKFIVQNFIEGLHNDWKVLVYGSKCYVLYRRNRKKDFRASGSGHFLFQKDIPEGLLDYAYSIKKHFNVPHISLDIGFDGTNFHLLEFQFIYFGTFTIEEAPFYFYLKDQKWEFKEERSDLENVYVQSIIEYLKEFL